MRRKGFRFVRRELWWVESEVQGKGVSLVS